MNSKPLYHTTRSGNPEARRATIGLAVLFLLAVLPALALAADMTGTSRTYLLYRETASDNKLAPIYEYLDLNVQDLGKETISVHFGGWLGYDLQDDSFGNDKKKGSDLQYGYVSYRAKERNAIVNLGRVMVFEGVAAARIDGAYARTDIKGGFGIAVYGGAPVETGTDQPGNSMIYGARLSHQNPGLYTVGVSYLKEDKNSATFREEAGIDLSVRPVNKVELMGRSSYNAVTDGWMEHSYYLILGPFEKIRFNTEVSNISYADYFAGATTSVFKFAPGGPLDPKEKVNIVGEEIFYSVNQNWSVSFDLKKYDYDIAGSAYYNGAKVTFAMPKTYNAGLSVHRMDGDTNRLRYDEYRIYASKKINKFDVALDVLDVKYKEPINSVSNAYSVTLASGYELTHKLKLGADLEYSKNPDFNKDIRFFAKVVYSFDAAGASHKPAAGQDDRKVTPEAAAPAAAPVAAPAPEQSATKPAAEPAAPAAAAPLQEAPAASVEPAASSGEQAKPKEGN